jgi:SOS response regulatory protein OraA/RecX
VGLFKQMKDMKNVVNQAPDMINQAQQLGAQAQEMAAAQQAAAQQAAAAAQANAQAQFQAGGPDFEPIAGVSLDLYAEISRELANHGYDQSMAAQVAATKGVSAESWQQAMEGWNGRMKTNPAVGRQFNKQYMGR